MGAAFLSEPDWVGTDALVEQEGRNGLTGESGCLTETTTGETLEGHRC